MTAHLLFPFGVRLSTWVCALAFIVLTVRYRDWRPLLAAAAWMWGFEIAFQVASIAVGHHDVAVLSRIGWLIIGVPVVVFASAWVRPDVRLLALAAVLFLAWLVTGFHVNEHTMVDFDATAEVLNSSGKTLLALAYLVPLAQARPVAHYLRPSRSAAQ